MDFVDHMTEEAVVLLPEGAHEVGVEEVLGSCYQEHLLLVEQGGLQGPVVRLQFLLFHSHDLQTGRHEGCCSG